MKIKLFISLFLGLILALIIEVGFIFSYTPTFKEFTSLLGLVLATAANFLFFRTVGLENPLPKALFVSLLGIILFWGACIGILLILAPGLSNM